MVHVDGAIARRGACLAVLTMLTAVLVAPGCGRTADPPAVTSEAWPTPLLSGPDRLVTNEYAHWNPADRKAIRSPVWDVTSGSLFVRNGVGYSGRADRGEVDARSSGATNSAVFRMATRSHGYGDVAFLLRFRLLGFSAPPRLGDDWDGLHLWLRHYGESQTYVASVARRDGTVVLKRKDPGGVSNAGTYVMLASDERTIAFGEWHTARVTVRTVSLTAVELSAAIDGEQVVRFTDDATRDGRPLLRPGAVGIRADNLEFEFADVRVAPLGPTEAP